MSAKRRLGAEEPKASAGSSSTSKPQGLLAAGAPAPSSTPPPQSNTTPVSGHSTRSGAPSTVSAVANSVLSATTRRARRGSIVYEASRVESKHFNAKELQNLSKQFNTWTNKQNVMDRDGFRKSLGLLGMVQDALLCHQLFRVFNKSGTGKIDFEEYVNGLGVLMKGSLDEKLDFSFNMTDIDGSGEISLEELVLTVDSMTRIYAGIMGGATSSHATSVDKEKIRKVFAHLDRNHDGKITLDEYRNGMKRHPEFLNTLRGTELFRPISSSSSSFRALASKTDKLEQALGEVLQELYRAEEALQRVKGDGDDHTLDDGGSGPRDDAREPHLDEIASALSKAKGICESNLPSSMRKSSFVLAGQTISQPAPSAPATPTSSKGEEEEEKSSENGGSTMMNGTSAHEAVTPTGNADLPAPPQLASQSKLDETANTNTDEWGLPDGAAAALPPLPSAATNKRKGLTVYFGHKNWDLVVNVMKGIQMAVSRSAMEQDRPVSPYDFTVKEKYTLVSAQDAKRSGGEQVEQRTRFVDYAPFVFAKLREYFHIDHEEYMNSIGPGSMLSNLMLGSLSSLAEMGSEGKSGAFFYLSSDNRFLVKTVRKDEHKLLRHILPSYFRHMTKNVHSDAADSLLTRIVGCHVVRSSKRSKTRTGAQKVYFVVMTNALETPLDVHRRYDLKGSWIGRRSTAAAREDSAKTLKDVDLTESEDRIFVDARMKQMLMSSLRRDASFLESHHIIDYSVLLGVHNISSSSAAVTSSVTSLPQARLSKEASDSSLGRPKISPLPSSNSLGPDQMAQVPPFFAQYLGGFKSSDNKQIYFMGIIDFLTQYGERKRLERFVKTIAHLNSSGLSVMPARMYAKRFLNFMDQRVIVADQERATYFASLNASQQLSTDLRHPRLE